ncbi:LysE family translocator [Thauera sp. CAU 1555]|uniref:LysE family translocator n=1 Tax=Thauera sedimentorum TaxID=2767595 RepID=A0ABR9BDQ7_9RHOO|nr:LysE family translocator [Thauera sedimentorum]MBC9073145.1 LysE family translocator [Thauera sedimentorum]MBD8504064.1 LysE family translocator [Thauera sedimentorum]
MLSIEQFAGFLLAAVLLTAAPGPDNMMVLSIGMSKGRRQGIVFGLGCALGCLSHTVLAVAGVSALIATSAEAFTALRICGGLYLLWLGVSALRNAGPAGVAAVQGGTQTLGRLFLKGVFANAINPKVVLFFLSFLPQFVVPEQGSPGLQMALLGVAFTVQAAVLFGLLGYFSGTVGQWLKRRPGVGTLLDRVAGAVFIALGLRLLVNR